ncbi:MAG TPA: ABC transporter ATP-binding protein [Thermoanaerobaculia bacterium]|nr:ABC transporter ATP-binding protein [Thermoanaerobaculia bacterium]
MDPTITVRNLSKRYSVDAARPAGNSLNDIIPNLVAGTFRRLTGRTASREELPAMQESEVWALKDVSFDLHAGDVFGIIGRNGAGKSTLLKVLSRVIKPTTGEVAFRGRLGSLLEVGAGFHPELSGRDNVFLSGSILGMKRHEIRRKFDAIVEFSELERFLDMPVKHYSNGMFVRLAFSVAAHLDPDILIIDEVLAVGDMRFQSRCREKIREITGPEKTILMVSHDLSAITALCNKAMLLESGRIAAAGDVRECIDRYMGLAGDGGKSAWSGDLGDDHIRLSSARIAPEQPLFQRGDSLDFEFTYDVLEPGPLVVVGVDIRNQVGAMVCATRFTDLAPAEQLASLQSAGRHTVRLTIDTSILSEGDYVLSVNLGIHNVKRVIEHEPVISFSLVDSTRNRRHESAMYRSMVYPDWEWAEVAD